ncbi:MAG: carboxymuconolactone decarboxylase family protein [Deltaproteobacteria bacterium]|nr:carboxymuconolactone decarboxylase family protein [Deltaproteobacteria bacterium]MBW2086268.1 carboxymuconolactone decarboxylase family protein [Deltaproteobacteria bacterium]
MAKIPYARIEDTPQKVQDFFVKLKANNPRIMNIHRMLAHSPGSVREFLRFGNRLLFKAELNPRFRELAIIRVASSHGSRYEWVQHVPIALRVGLTREQIEDIENWPESPLFTAEEKVVLAFTEEVLRDSRPTEETFTLAAKFLNPASLVELTLSIGYWSMVAKFLETFEVEVEEDLMRELKDVLPHKMPGR